MPEELTEKYEPTAQSIRNWAEQEDCDAGQRADGLSAEEREILKKRRPPGSRGKPVRSHRRMRSSERLSRPRATPEFTP
jgi:hypothetical protein